MSLYDELTAYSASDAYPFHMPGHKRRTLSMQDPYSFDITEIDGFDDLHHPSGILLEAQERAAALYHSEETHFLVNGSTAGVLSAICASVPSGGLLLMARNSHRCAYHAASLRNIRTRYLYPEMQGPLNGPILPETVERALRGPGAEKPDAIFLTSPTYDGVVSDVEAIAKIAHHSGVPLIVDEAHGAHFGMHPAFPPSSVSLGADLVIHSLHKTLPALTQTALLHVNGTLADRGKLRRMLSVFQTSSPSYVLMASIDSCIGYLAENRDTFFSEYTKRLERFRAQAHFQHMDLPRTDDPSRILLFPSHMSAPRLYDLLRDRYHLQPEMLAPEYVLMLSSASDSEEGLTRLLEALRELDRTGEGPDGQDIPDTGRPSARPEETGVFDLRARARFPLSCSFDAAQEEISWDACEGAVSAEYLYLYPPGIPLLAPGEVITGQVRRCADDLTRAGFRLQGTADPSHRMIRIIKEDTPK